jgi:hypothetical protein
MEACSCEIEAIYEEHQAKWALVIPGIPAHSPSFRMGAAAFPHVVDDLPGVYHHGEVSSGGWRLLLRPDHTAELSAPSRSTRLHWSGNWRVDAPDLLWKVHFDPDDEASAVLPAAWRELDVYMDDPRRKVCLAWRGSRTTASMNSRGPKPVTCFYPVDPVSPFK